MLASTRRAVLAAGALAPLVTGCVYTSPRFWSEQQQEMTLPVGDLDSVQVNTHNGHVYLTGEEGLEEIHVVVKKRAGGWTAKDTEACMEAIDVFAEQAGRTEKLGWKWKGVRPQHWQAQVSFEVTVPKRFASAATTHNGKIRLVNVEGKTRLITHNGSVFAEGFEDEADIETHNGSLDVKGRVRHVRLTTHNGRIVADLRGSESVGGSIITQNGGVRVALGEEVDALLEAGTHNGHIDAEVNLQDARIKRSHISGRLGRGGDLLKISTHNGSITLTK